MVKVLAVLGDFYHPGELAKESLEYAFRSQSGLDDFQVIYCSYESLKDELSNQPDGVILFKENRLNPSDEDVKEWMTEELAYEITRYVDNGGGWMAWHSGLASYSLASSYTKMLRGSFISHPDKHQLVHYKNVLENSSIPAIDSFEFMDEHYFVRCDETNTNIFLLSESVDGQSIAGWSHNFGNGKVCCLTPAHTIGGLLNPSFLTVLGNCINWIVSK
jgi:type 1 glutamine amidotransferase